MFITVKLDTLAIIILLIIGIVEFSLHPRIDKTVDGKVILWYGRRRRRYKILLK